MRAVILVLAGIALIAVSLALDVAYPSIGVVVGAVLALVGACPLMRRWPSTSDGKCNERNV